MPIRLKFGLQNHDEFDVGHESYRNNILYEGYLQKRID